MKKIEKLLSFINSSPTAYHTVAALKSELEDSGYTELSSADISAFADGGKHFVISGGTSIIAFSGRMKNGFMICASHSDSPSFRVKLSGESVGAYTRISTEKYGGMIHYTWLDRPLSVAGRVVVRSVGGVEERLCNIDRDALVIPSLAIHLNRGVNDGAKHNPAIDLVPLAGLASGKNSLTAAIAAALSVSEGDIISHDLFVYNRDKGSIGGLSDELIISPRLDDLECVHASLRAFLDSSDTETDSVKVLAVFDNEEVGSETKQGAASSFLHDTLLKIAGNREKYYSMLDNSFMVSADNAHAKHPNHPELSDSENAPILGSGVVVKYNGNQRYTTDGLSDAIFRTIAESSDIKLQRYYNRADLPGGSTLGSIASAKVPLPAIDIGLAQLAMHSATETAAVSDYLDMERLLTAFYRTSLLKKQNKTDIITK